MAFTRKGLNEVSFTGNNRVHWAYFTADSLATCLGANYFASGGGDKHYFHVGDGIEISASGGAEFMLLQVSAVSNGVVTVIGTNGLAAGQQTGFTAGTGTPNKGAFAADTATAAQAAQRVLALEQALRTLGLIN